MPGIFGIISDRPSGQNMEELESMGGVMRHESFYVTGSFQEPELFAYVGWVSHPDSPAAHMPIESLDQRGVLIFFGEDFSIPLLTGSSGIGSPDSLVEKGRDLLDLYRKEPDKFPSSLNGWFQGLILDRERRQLLLFNDRHGFQRLYIYPGKDAVYFASEAKAILRIKRELRSLDEDSFADLITCGCVLEGRSLFPGLNLLPGASRWIFREGRLHTKEKYFSPRVWEEQEPLQKEEFKDKLEEELPEIINRYLQPEGNVALSLTGGLDTRIILSHGQPRSGALPCYTFGGIGRDSYDVKIARTVAGVAGQSFKTLNLDEEFLQSFTELAERTVYLTDGTMNMGGVPELYLNNKAREEAPIRLTGNYGTEVLRRSAAFRPSQLQPGLFIPDVHRLAQKAKATYSEAFTGNPLSFILFKQVPWFHYNRFAVEQSQLTLRSPFLDADLLKLLYRAPPDIGQDESLSLSLIDAGNRALGFIPTDWGAGGKAFWRKTRILKTWRQFLFRAEYAFDYGMPDRLARIDHFLTPLRPERVFMGLHKFYHLRTWFKNELSSFVKDVLLDPAALKRPYLNPGSVEILVKEHMDGSANHTLRINQLLALEFIHRCFIDSYRNE